MMYSNLRIAGGPHILEITFHRPERRNAINRATVDELTHVVEECQASPDLRCVILTGAGSDAFIAGGDLKELGPEVPPDQALDTQQRMREALRRLEQLDCPVLMAINGVAIGGGCEVMLAGDRRLMAAETTLTFRQATLGLSCGWGGLTRLERLVGRAKAFQILLLEGPMHGTRALELGLVDELVPRAQLMDRVREVAATLAALPPLALRAIKRGLMQCPELPLEQALAFEAELFAHTWTSADHWEALEAFFSKRPPTFQGR